MPGSAQIRHALFGLAVYALGGCAATPPPTQELAVAESALAAARAARAADYAPVEFGFAQEKLDAARAANDKRDFTRAMAAAAEAEVDAELALAKSRAALKRAEVQEKSQANAALRRELLGEEGRR